MRNAGLAQIEAAKADGRWVTAYAPASTAKIPADLQNALNAKPLAAKFFANLKGANRYAILYRIGSVKRPETRARKIAEYVAMLERGDTIHGSANVKGGANAVIGGKSDAAPSKRPKIAR